MKRFVAILLILVLVFALSATALLPAMLPAEKATRIRMSIPIPARPPPQTGESFSILWVILAAVAAVGAVLFCGKKLVRAK